MKSEWKISSMYLDGKKVYQVYRIKDMRKVDHSDNREYAGGLLHDEREAMARAEKLNAKRVMSEWRVDTVFQMTNGYRKIKRAYEVCRMIDPDGPNYGDNVQHAGLFQKKHKALAEAKRLNAEAES